MNMAVIKSSSSHKSMTVQTVLHNNHLNTYYVNYVEGVTSIITYLWCIKQ